MSSEAPRRIEITDPVTITVDGEAVTVQKGELLIDACERSGTYIPRFCYHPRMTPVGMCRMCLVDVDTGRGPALQPSCMLECTDGMVVGTETDRVKKAQDGVLEFLLINHPLDCPVCDKGGECPLQDQTMAYGPGESRFVEEKRHYVKPIEVSETVLLDRERCILCDRCTRFADEVAGDPLIHFMDRGSATQVNTFPGEPFASYFSGNTVQICPVGALTAKPFRFVARPWDLNKVESTCTTCAVGCRITVESSRDEVLRTQGVDSDPVNWGWLCDKGRFGFEALNSEDRLREPLMRRGDRLEPARWNDALRAAADAIRAAADPGRVAVIGGARLTNESAYAWARLAKSVIGTDHVDAQLGDGINPTVLAGLPRASIDEVCESRGVVLYIGPDVREELPVLFLRLKHAVERDGVRLIEIVPARTALSKYATATLVVPPGRAAEVVAALATTAAVDGINAEQLAAARAAYGVGAGESVSVLIGRSNVAEGSEFTTAAIAAAVALRDGVRFLPLLRRGNVNGALDMGLAPGLLPGRRSLDNPTPALTERWGALPTTPGLDTAGILAAAAEGRIDTLILLGADPIADFPDQRLADRGLTGARQVIVVDTFLNDSSQRADIVLPAAGFGESSGTTTNIEGRVTVLEQKVTPPGTARPDWVIATDLAAGLGTDFGVFRAGALWDEVVAVSPVHAELDAASLANRPDGIRVADAEVAGAAAPAGAAVVPNADSYGFRIVALRSLYDEGTQVSHSRSSAGLAVTSSAHLHPLDAERLGVNDGDQVELHAGDRSLTLPVLVDARLPRGTVGLVQRGVGGSVNTLIDAGHAVNDVRIEVR
jgi:NADH-quinone oxidoreductase subunit G